MAPAFPVTYFLHTVTVPASVIVKMFAFTPSSALLMPVKSRSSRPRRCFTVLANNLPSFLPKEVENIQNPFARSLASRIERLPVNFSVNCILSSCVKPSVQSKTSPVVLLHGFDSSCLEWRYTFPLLEEAAVETWAVDILGWGLSDLERLPSCDVASKRNHLNQFWRSHIRRPVILRGPSLGAAVAINFAVNHPEAVGCLNCLYPWLEDATVNFMLSGGYDVSSLIEKVEKTTLINWVRMTELLATN